MNKGLDRATGQYIIFMNSGDRFAGAGTLARIAGALDENGGSWDFLFGDALEEAAGGDLLLKRARPASFVSYGMFTHHQAMLYARRAIAGMRYDCTYVIAGDYDFTCRLLARGASSLYLGFPVTINKRGGLSEKNTGIGRRENLAIQKTVLNLGLARRATNYAAFLGSSFMRTYLRGLYDLIRFRQNIPLNGSPLKG
jgi:putative colanic acid biosynthesis glycosyltransferase